MIKKIVIILIIISNIFLLSGCWDLTEIDDSEIVAGVAIDKGKNGFKYHYTVELINLLPADSQSEHASRIVEIDGDTLIEATRKLITLSYKKLYYAHCKVAIINEDVAREGIIPILDVFLRHYTSSLEVDIIIAKGCDAKDILSQKSVTSSPNAFDIKIMLNSNKKSLSASKRMELFNAVNDLETEGASLTLPVLIIEKKEDKSSFKLNGIAVFDKDKLIGYLDDDESKFFLFVTDEFVNGIYSTKIDSNQNLFVSTLIFKNKTKIKPELVNNELSINIQTKTVASIVEMATYDELKDEPEFKKLKAQLENQLQNNIRGIISKVQKDFGIDIFGFGKALNETNHSLWKAKKSNWNETFKTLKVDVKSEFIIRSTEYIHHEIKSGG